MSLSQVGHIWRPLVNRFVDSMKSYGLTVGPFGTSRLVLPRNIPVNRPQLRKKIDEHLREQAKYDFILVILPGEDVFIYDTLKTSAEINHGIMSVCVVGSKFNKDQRWEQYNANVCLKVNIRHGGINHRLEGNLSPLDQNTILFGLDVTHPSPGSGEGAPSISGVVASQDGHFAHYPGSLRVQTGRQEMVDNLSSMVLERLRYWRKRNNRLPEKVIIYRDGVSEGQYNLVLDVEVPEFRKAFDALYGDRSKHPKMTVIVVGKRHHTRFYPANQANLDSSSGNCMPGTVVDRGITGERTFDFFLVAHQGLKGTSKPAHYVVILDENKFKASSLQTATHNLCYNFGRATRAVSVCPPAYYADLICERGRAYLHDVLKENKGDPESGVASNWQGPVHPRLQDKMFYL